MNARELQRVLSDEIYKLRSGSAKPERTNAVVNAAGKIIAIVRLELQYAKLVGAQHIIPFMTATNRLGKTTKK